MPEAARTFGQVNGRDVRGTLGRVPSSRRGRDREDVQVWFDKEGYEADIPTLREEYPDLTTFEQYLRQSGWEEA